MTDLITRLEAATEGSRELDDEIARAMLEAKQPIRLMGMSDDEPSVPVFQYADGSTGTSLRYTTSLDAAVTLIPEGYDWIVADVNGHVGGTPYACVGDETQHFGETPALAFCIAALRARGAGQ
jgi:hypothetical protein